MRRFWFSCAVLLWLSPSPAIAQGSTAPPAKIEHFDAAGYVGGSSRPGEHSYGWFGDWTGAASVGYYWTNHVKTEVAFSGTGSNTYQSDYRYVQLPGPPVRDVNTFSSTTARTRRLSVLHEYQFFRNSMVHPFVGAGAAIAWERGRTTTIETIFTPVPPPGFGSYVTNTTIGPVETRVRLHALAMAGVKAYFNERVFFRVDLSVGAGRRFETVAWRIGFGWDF